MGTICHELQKTSCSNQDAVWDAELSKSWEHVYYMVCGCPQGGALLGCLAN